jgi:peptidoglycan/LPS O-acetylase OafA/YrhL
MEDNSRQSTHIEYRPDLDGLRAVAVIFVVVFHAFPKLLPGGFVGVDVFFVISGYLISSIIIKSLQVKKFSFLEFYSRRIRRIFPAVILVLVTCVAFGYFVLLPLEYKQLAKHVTGSASFLSNIVLWRESGYFDNAAETKPLLHFWSLAIEEQFYLAWPLVLWLAFRANLNWVTIAVGFTGVSFFLNIHNIAIDETGTFYSFQTRIWEILVGAILALLSAHRKAWIGWANRVDSSLGCIIYAKAPVSCGDTLRGACSLFGTALIVTSAVIYSKAIAFPGVWALLPVVGATLLILSGPDTWLSRRLLANPLMVWIGLISFPLYLWHWPLLSFARILEGQPLTSVTKVTVILIAVFLAWLTYSFLEKPIRKTGVYAALSLLVFLISLGSAGYFIHSKEGLPERGPSLSSDDTNAPLNLPNVALLNTCGLPESEVKGFICISDSRPPVPKYALLGDSKADAMAAGLIKTSDERGRWLFIGGGTAGKPVPVISDHHLYRSYQDATKRAITAIAENKQIEVVVLVAATRILFNLRNDSDIEDLATSKNYAVALDGLQNVISLLKNANKKVVLVTDNPTLPHPEDCIQRITQSAELNAVLKQTSNLRCQLPIARHLELSKKYRELLAELVVKNSGDVFIFDITDIMCSVETQQCATKKNDRRMYSVTDHVSEYAASLIGIELNEYLAKLTR